MADGKRVLAPKGMNDVRPGAAEGFLDTAIWDRIFSVAAEVMESYGYRKVWLPAVEETSLFARGIGEGTDIVAKEMFSFEDRAGRPLTLRPEGTAGAVRAYVQAGVSRDVPKQRWWYGGPMFRAERPQKGRYRQFYQFGAELFAAKEPTADAEVVAMVWQICQRLGLSDLSVRINTLGDGESRVAYRAVLQSYLRERSESLCEPCTERIESNPLRVLDCKREGCRAVAAEAPDILEVLTDSARAHFDRVTELLTELGVPFERDRRLVRGLDYYTGSIFEITTGALGAQDAILGGGRYDELVEQLGGMPTPAIGFAAGVERIALLLAALELPAGGPALYIVPMAGTELAAMRLADEIRASGVRVEVDVGGGRLKQQMKRADRSGAQKALVLGENEVQSGRAKLKDLGVSSEAEVDLNAAALVNALR